MKGMLGTHWQQMQAKLTESKLLIVDSLHKINSDTNLHLKLFHVLCTD